MFKVLKLTDSLDEMVYNFLYFINNLIKEFVYQKLKFYFYLGDLYVINILQ